MTFASSAKYNLASLVDALAHDNLRPLGHPNLHYGMIPRIRVTAFGLGTTKSQRPDGTNQISDWVAVEQPASVHLDTEYTMHSRSVDFSTGGRMCSIIVDIITSSPHCLEMGVHVLAPGDRL
jgi:hypothetical protein